ncbi:purine and uridine phosphorylase [Aspergillus pseudoustus]|uniref:Purine and uridine phosphorylase n=1 Tax=Aspergillus pseudoustus TaxID=1810923 RepID=A0ABR4IIX2_9EURO
MGTQPAPGQQERRQLPQTRTRNAYTVGWICALPNEQTAATAMLDERHDEDNQAAANPLNNKNDFNAYTLGSIGAHNIVIACLPQGKHGTNSAVTVAAHMVATFPGIRVGLLVGIGGGILPDVRLGDIVVSSPGDGYPGIVQWDFGKAEVKGEEEEGGGGGGEKLRQTGALNNPPMTLLSAVSKLRTIHDMEGSRIAEYLADVKSRYPRLATKYTRRTDTPRTNANNDDRSAQERAEDEVRIHHGLIASGNRVIKDAKVRDMINGLYGGHVLCIEMEAAGLMDNFPCLVIRGICDYADVHKTKDWQEYAAVVAAAYAKELLSIVPRQQIEQMPAIEKLLSALDRKFEDLSNGIQNVRSQQLNQEHQAIVDWISPVDYGTQQSDNFGRRQPGTGQWLLDSAEYRTWIDSEGGTTLFCPGIPGAGKTILSSIIINDLGRRFFDRSKSVGVGYIYCNFRREHEQRITNLLATLLKQLTRGQSQDCMPKCVRSLHDDHAKDGTRPCIQEILETLQSVMKLYSRVFIVVDALDECQVVDGCRGKLLSELFHIQAQFPVNICITSRPLVDITISLNGALTLEIRARKDDVARYVESHMGTLRSVVQTNAQLQTDIIMGIADAVDGMFLLAQIYIQSLQDKVTENEVRSALERIQKQKHVSGGDKDKLLSAAYDQATERINREEVGLRMLAIRILSWITCVKRQLTTKELQHALATKKGKRALDIGDIVPIEDMVSVCAGLVTVDEESDVVRLAHYTTQEYFSNRRNELFPDVESDITTTCVTYMSFDVFGSGYCQTNAELTSRLSMSPFYDYAAHHWGTHARESPTLCQEVIAFFESDPKVEASGQVLQVRPNTSLTRCISGSGRSDRVCRRTPLSWAAENGNERVVQVLLEHGADIESRDKYGQTPLSRAASCGQEAIVRLLIGKNADLESRDFHGRSPLLCAKDSGVAGTHCLAT